MRKITRISYFRRNEKKVFNQLAFGQHVRMILDSSKLHSKWINKSLGFITFIDKNTNKVLHRFRVEPKKDKFTDLTCSRNCYYTYALALRSNWLVMKSETFPVTQWYNLDDVNTRKFRVEIKENDFIVRYKDRYNNVILDGKTLAIWNPEAFRFIGKIKKLMNLKQIRRNPLLLRSFIKKSKIDSGYRTIRNDSMLHDFK